MAVDRAVFAWVHNGDRARRLSPSEFRLPGWELHVARFDSVAFYRDSSGRKFGDCTDAEGQSPPLFAGRNSAMVGWPFRNSLAHSAICSDASGLCTAGNGKYSRALSLHRSSCPPARRGAHPVGAAPRTIPTRFPLRTEFQNQSGRTGCAISEVRCCLSAVGPWAIGKRKESIPTSRSADAAFMTGQACKARSWAGSAEENGEQRNLQVHFSSLGGVSISKPSTINLLKLENH